MLKRFCLGLAMTLGLAGGAMAAESGEVHDVDFSFEGPFGSFDRDQLQRGLQVFTEVCSGCHGTKQLYFRNLSDPGGPGYSAAEVKAYAANFTIFDDTHPVNVRRYFDLDKQEMRGLLPSDKFPVYMSANGPDLSLMAKSRAAFHGPLGSGINQLFKGTGGPEYIVAILTSYTGKTKEQAGTTLYENTAFPGGWISMAPPLSGEDVEYADGHSNSLHHEAEDIAAYLMWVAEPKMMARKEAGLRAVLFLTILAALLYLTNKKLWSRVKGKPFGSSS